MGIKYYELQVKKLVNFAGVSYALTSDVALKLSKDEFELFQTEFETFQNGIGKLGTAAEKQFVEYTSKRIGTYDSFEGITADYEIGDVVNVGEVDYICLTTEGSAEENFIALNECVTSFSDFLKHAENKNIHITSAERTKWDNVSTNLGEHSADSDIHITADERIAWDGAVSDLSEHIDDGVAHITANERADWNKKLDTEDIKQGNNISVTYNDDGTVTISGTAEYVLPTASEETLGGVKVGETVNVDENGVLNINKADAENLGGIKLGFGLQKNGEDGVVDAVAKTTAPISVTKDIGYLKMGSTISKGSTLTDILTSLLTTYITPVISSLTLAETGPKEVGETATISKLTYSFDNNYTVYGKESVLKSGTVKFFDGNTSGTDITSDGTFTGNTGVPPKSTSLTLTKSISLNPPANGTTGSHTFSVSCGYIKEDGSDGTVSKSTSISWQLAYFKGISATDGMPYKVDENGAKLLVRSNGTRVLNPSKNTKVSTMTAGNGDKMVWVAYPKSVRPAKENVTSIIALDSMNAQVKDAFTYEEIKVALDDGTVLDYTLCYLKPDGGFTQQARYDIIL